MISFIKKHYHWVIAVVMLVEMAAYGGLLNNLNGLFVIPVTTTLQIPRSTFALGMSAKGVTCFLSTMFSGPLFHRFGYKKMTLIGLTVASVSLLLMSFATHINVIIIASAVMGLCDGFCCIGMASMVISKWFHRFQGTVLGIVSAATGFGGSLMCTLLSSAIETSGWNTAYMVSAIVIFGTCLLLLFTMHDHPSKLGLRPYGLGHMPKKKKHRKEDDHWLGYTMQELYRKPSMYLLMAAVFCSGLAVNMGFILVIPHFQGQGLSASEAASLQSWLLVFLTVSKMLLGTVSDWIGRRLVAILSMCLSVVSLYYMSCAHTYTEAMISIVLHSIALPVTTVLIPLLTYPLFGYRCHNSSLGIFLSMVSVGSIINTPLANAIFDQTGNYILVLQLMSLLSGVSVVLFGVLFILAARDKKKYQALHNESPV